MENLTCDCYPGCWGDHSENWPKITGDDKRLRTLYNIAVKERLPRGSFVIAPDSLRFNDEALAQRVLDIDAGQQKEDRVMGKGDYQMHRMRVPTGSVLDDVHDERLRQDKLQLEGKFPYTCAMPNGFTDAEKLGVLAEEFGEVAQLVCACKIPDKLPVDYRATASVRDMQNTYQEKLREELIQVAAVCVAWAESIEVKT